VLFSTKISPTFVADGDSVAAPPDLSQYMKVKPKKKTSKLLLSMQQRESLRVEAVAAYRRQKARKALESKK